MEFAEPLGIFRFEVLDVSDCGAGTNFVQFQITANGYGQPTSAQSREDETRKLCGIDVDHAPRIKDARIGIQEKRLRLLAMGLGSKVKWKPNIEVIREA